MIPFSSQQPRNEATPWSRFFPPGVNFDKPGLKDLARYVYSRPAGQAIGRLVEEHPVDLAHLHIYYGQLTGAILQPLREAGVPIVQTLHDLKLVCPVYSLMSHGQICEACQGHQFWRATAKRCNRGSLSRSLLSTVESYVSRWAGSVDLVDRFISVSHFQRDKFVELGVPAEKITTIHNFIETAGVEPETTPGDYLLYFGRIERLKGIFTLIEAAALAPNMPLVIVGRGEAEPEVARQIEARGLKNVKLLGFKQGADLEQIIRGSIATIVASEGYDNCPMAILESYSYGKGVVGSRIGGIPELVAHEEDGFIVAPGNAQELADRLNWLAEHRQEAVEMGLAGRRKVEREFNSEVHYRRLAEVYESLAPQGKHSTQRPTDELAEPVGAN